MDVPGLQAAGDLSEARWVAARLGGAIGTVTRTVPGGYPAYARVCHPVEDETGSLVTWTEVAEVTGRRPHPLMQWHALIGSSNAVNPRSADWAGSNPTLGSLEPEVLAPLCDVLSRHTETPVAHRKSHPLGLTGQPKPARQARRTRAFPNETTRGLAPSAP